MRVLLYAKDDCGLCDAFHFELLDLQSELGFAYEKRHLAAGDPLLTELAGRFPVVDIETTDTDTDEPIRLTSPTSQRQLRTLIREMAAPSLAAEGS